MSLFRKKLIRKISEDLIDGQTVEKRPNLLDFNEKNLPSRSGSRG